MKKMMLIAAAVMLLPLCSLQASPWVGTQMPNLEAVVARATAPVADDDDPYHRSGREDGETRLDVVDVLVAYDKSAQDWLDVNHQGTMEDFAVSCINKANYCLLQSAITQFKFRLVGTIGIANSYSNIPVEPLLMDYIITTNGITASEGELKKVIDARESTGADIVSFLVDTKVAGAVGAGYSQPYTSPLMLPWFADWAYNVCSISAVKNGYTMVHEIGHNMGCGHPDASLADPLKIDPGPQSYGYSAGFYFWKDGVGYNTIMGYNFGGIGPTGLFNYNGPFTPLPVFSSPVVYYNGTPVGDMNHDNRKVLLSNYKYVAQYRTSKVDVEITGSGSGGAGDSLKPITWYTSKAEAVAAANTAHKKILLVSGKTYCPNTQAAMDYIEQDMMVNTEVDANFVCWFDDNSDVWETVFWYYCTSYGSEGLPLVCIIDPASPEVATSQLVGPHSAVEYLELVKRAGGGSTPAPTPTKVVVSMPSYKSEFTYDGGMKKSLVSVSAEVAVTGTSTAKRVGSYSYTMALPAGNYEWANGTTSPITVNWKIKAATPTPLPTPIHTTDDEIKPSAPGYVLPKLFNGTALTPFVGNATYNGWVRGADNSLSGMLTVKAAKPGSGNNCKLTVSYTPCGGRKQTVKTVAAAGGNPVVTIPGIGTVKLGGNTFEGVGVKLQTAQDYSKSKDAVAKNAYLAALSSKSGIWTFAFNTDKGYAAFSVSIDAKGKGKLSGTLPDGTKVSVTAQGALGDNGFAIPFAYGKKGAFGFVFWAKNNGTAELSDVTKVVLANGAVLKVNSWTAPSKTRLMAGGNHTFVCNAITQDFTVAGVKWDVPKVDSKLKLKYTVKTGLVKGSFTKGGVKYDVNGVVVGTSFYGAAAPKGRTPELAWAD